MVGFDSPHATGIDDLILTIYGLRHGQDLHDHGVGQGIGHGERTALPWVVGGAWRDAPGRRSLGADGGLQGARIYASEGEPVLEVERSAGGEHYHGVD